MADLDGVDAKLERLSELLDELNAAVSDYLDGSPIETRGSLSEDGRFSARIHASEPPPLRASVIVGDFAHNARSALDHLLWQLVLANNERPSRGNQWPILDRAPSNSKERSSYERMTAGVGASALQRIESAQPYQRDDSPDLHVLYALRELSNTDKHRLPLAMLIAIDEAEAPELDLNFRDVVVASPARYGLVVSTPLESGDEVLFIDDVRISGPSPSIEPRGTLPIQVAFGEVATTTQGLLQIRDYLLMVRRDFAMFFGD